MRSFFITAALVALCLSPIGTAFPAPQTAPSATPVTAASVRYQTAKVNGLDIFYREAGSPKNPTVVLLHGFPTSSAMFRNLIPALADRYHVIAPDYPGFGNSSAPGVREYEYTFDNLANVVETLLKQKGVTQYSLYVQDYGAPVGYRLFARNPERVQALIVQNGNAYEEGVRDFWKPLRAYWADRSEANANALRESFKLDATRWQYTHGTRDPLSISPDTWNLDQSFLNRPGNHEIQLALFYDYRNNLARYPAWQELFRKYQPPTLIVWGKNDVIFPAEGAHPYKRDLKNIEFHLLDTGHFALEEDGALIAGYMREFLKKNVSER
jgi:pimeloyl-ACP methyl ester carboxylesterase